MAAWACLLAILAAAAPAFSADAPTYKVRVISAAGSQDVIVRVLVTQDGETRVAETAFRANEISSRGAFAPARVSTDVTDSPIQGMHVRSFNLDVVDPSGAVTGSERMTAVVNFDEHAVVTFFSGAVSDANGRRVVRCLLWGYPPGVQREL